MAITKVSSSLIKGSSVNVIDYISGGSGTDLDPYVGWDTAISWSGNTEYKFTEGVFEYGTTLDLAYTGLRIRGVGRATVLKFTGSGNCISLDGSSNNVQIEGIHIIGNPSATNGIYTNNSNYGICKNVIVSSVSNAGFRSLFGVYWNIENFYMGNNFGVQTVTPAAGILLGSAGVNETVTSYAIINVNIADCTSSGIDIGNGWGNTVLNGAVEINGDQGLYIGANGHDNTILGLYIEGNPNKAVEVNGTANDLISLWCFDSGNPPLVFSGGSNNHVYGGVYGDITINSGVLRTEFTSVRTGGTFTDNGTGTSVVNLYSLAISGYIHPTFLTGWTNDAVYPYETLTTSGSNITSAINSSGFGIAYSNVIKLSKGMSYLFQWNVTLNSGTLPGFSISTNNNDSAIAVSKEGINSYMFTPGIDGDYYFVLRNESGVASNFSVSGMDIKRLN